MMTPRIGILPHVNSVESSERVVGFVSKSGPKRLWGGTSLRLYPKRDS